MGKPKVLILTGTVPYPLITGAKIRTFNLMKALASEFEIELLTAINTSDDKKHVKAIEEIGIECHVIDSAFRHGVRKLLYLASSCCYPKVCPQPMQTNSMFTGPVEPTNEAYAMAKIAGIKLCQAYRQQYNANYIYPY